MLKIEKKLKLTYKGLKKDCDKQKLRKLKHKKDFRRLKYACKNCKDPFNPKVKRIKKLTS
jgi:hypothetical protein